MTRNQTGTILTVGAMVCAVLLPEFASAQGSGQPNSGIAPQAEAPAPSRNCDAPVDPSKKGDRLPQSDADLSRKLEDCNGVLQAPQSGDTGIVTPAPDTGNSRVIKPGDVPANSNPSNGSGG